MVARITFESVHAGQQLPRLDVPITASLIVAGAIATSDFSLVHHDKAHAQAAGTPDIFMNILTSNGLMMTYLEQWAGPQAMIKDISIKLSVPNFPRDRMDMNARVTRKWQDKGEHLIEVAFSGDNQMGPHANGTAIISLPTRG